MRIIHDDEKVYAGALVLKAIGGPHAFRGLPTTFILRTKMRQSVISAQALLERQDIIEADLPRLDVSFDTLGTQPQLYFTESHNPHMVSFGSPRACVLIRCPITSTILSHNDDYIGMKLPEGGIYKGEGSLAAAARILREQLGVVLASAAFVSDPFWYQGCVTYEFKQKDVAFVVDRVHPSMRMAWVSEAELLCGRNERYNRRLLETLDQRRRAL